MNEPRPTTISARPREMRSSVANCSNTRTGSAALRTATALVKRMCLVRAAAAARITAGAESRNSLRWCSPTPNTSNPTLSACSISSSRSFRRSAGLTVGLASPIAAAKLSTPISIVHSEHRSPRDCSPVLVSVRLEDLGRGLIGSELLDPLAACAHERERLFRRPCRRVALEVEVEDVVPRRRAARTRLDLAQLDPGRRERLKRADQGSRQVRGLVHEARLGGPLAERGGDPVGDVAARLRCYGEEAREVVARSLDRLLKDVQAVALRRAAARDRRDGRICAFGDLGR